MLEDNTNTIDAQQTNVEEGMGLPLQEGDSSLQKAVPSDAYVYRINNITLKNGQTITPSRLNIFIGANNCGKTQLLKEILFRANPSPDFIRDSFQIHPVLTDAIDICLPETVEQVLQSYKHHFNDIQPHEPNYCLSPLLTGRAHTYGDCVTNINVLSTRLIAYLNTDSRLSLARTHAVSAGSTSFNNRSADNILEEIYKTNSGIIDKIAESVAKIFKKKIYLNPYEIGSIGFKFGDDFSNIPSHPVDANKELQKYPSLDQQGDGVRSTVGILSVLIGCDRPVILLDEPETFLHPPHAYQLGKIISDLIKDGQQIFISTHSVDFLKGVLSSLKASQDEKEVTRQVIDTSDISIFHLQRGSKSTHINELNSGVINKLTSDPILASSRVIDGLFYQGIVATEADADAIFYQRAFTKIEDSGEIHFIQGHNKQTLKKVVEPFQALDIKFAMIADIDIIRDQREFRAALEPFTTKKHIDQLITLSSSVMDFINKSDFDKQLSNVLNELKTLLVKHSKTEEDSSLDEQSKTDDGALCSREKLMKLRSSLSGLEEKADYLDNLKRKGVFCFDDSKVDGSQKVASDLKQLLSECQQLGLFIVPVGELEGWLADYGLPYNKRKSKWISEALVKLASLNPDDSGRLWKFMKQLRDYMLKEDSATDS